MNIKSFLDLTECSQFTIASTATMVSILNTYYKYCFINPTLLTSACFFLTCWSGRSAVHNAGLLQVQWLLHDTQGWMGFSNVIIRDKWKQNLIPVRTICKGWQVCPSTGRYTCPLSIYKDPCMGRVWRVPDSVERGRRFCPINSSGTIFSVCWGPFIVRFCRT
jgi:hypothetical protein